MVASSTPMGAAGSRSDRCPPSSVGALRFAFAKQSPTQYSSLLF
jgi:hypothetical protein